MKYWIDGEYICFFSDDRGGRMHKDYQGVEMQEYLAWLAEGNTPEPWEL